MVTKATIKGFNVDSFLAILYTIRTNINISVNKSEYFFKIY